MGKNINWNIILIGLIFILAFGIRILFFIDESHNLPLFTYYGDDTDMAEYQEWANEILDGDVLSISRGVYHQAPLYP